MLQLWILPKFLSCTVTLYFILTCIRFVQFLKLLLAVDKMPFHELTSSRFNELISSNVSGVHSK
jgi:hypothetical protein